MVAAAGREQVQLCPDEQSRQGKSYLHQQARLTKRDFALWNLDLTPSPERAREACSSIWVPPYLEAEDYLQDWQVNHWSTSCHSGGCLWRNVRWWWQWSPSDCWEISEHNKKWLSNNHAKPNQFWQAWVLEMWRRDNQHHVDESRS